MKRHIWIILAVICFFMLTAFIEWKMGRLFLGPDGRFGWWEGNIWSSEQSQRFADPYSITHIEHGLIFYGLLWLVGRKIPWKYRLLMAVGIESGWEILENSPIIINRYREATIALGYTGDSILNSLSDILMMSLGFLLASRWKLWISISSIIMVELILLFWVRDNLALNILMLIYPLDIIKQWQMMGKPL
jgi:hypothetical protein